MGTDVVDINNDGYVDVISLEMLPENNLRKKRMLTGNEYYNYINNAQYGYTHQYVRNVVQLNSGPTPLGHPVFSDLGFLAGVYQTDWSWCPLVADFDNDGYRDMIITNGLPRDVTDNDYIEYNNGQSGASQRFTLAMTDSLPVVKLANYAFKNTNGLQFENVTQAWGMGQLSFSNGAAYADLDNDGDLDVIINNLNDPPLCTKIPSILRTITSPSRWRARPETKPGLGRVCSCTMPTSGSNSTSISPCAVTSLPTISRAHFGLGHGSPPGLGGGALAGRQTATFEEH